MVPNIGLQSTIDKPESVNLVRPPIIMIARTIIVSVISQINIDLLYFFWEYDKFIKTI